MRSQRLQKKVRIRVADSSGYCFGVRRALTMAENALARQTGRGRICSLHPIIHNAHAVSRLAEKGLRTVNSLRGMRAGDSVIISSHGATRDVFERVRRRRLHVIDATCPRVVHAQRLILRLNRQGFYVAIIGERRHPEVKALRSLAHKGCVVETERDIRAIPASERKIGVVAQTTQSKQHVRELLDELIRRDFFQLEIFNTLCHDTLRRQSEALALARQVERMIVVGGRHSANTRRLAELCRPIVPTCHIETAEEIDRRWVRGIRSAGIVSGASTPDWLIEAVTRAVMTAEKRL